MNRDLIKYRLLYFLPLYIKPILRGIFRKSIFSEIDIIYDSVDLLHPINKLL